MEKMPYRILRFALRNVVALSIDNEKLREVAIDMLYKK